MRRSVAVALAFLLLVAPVWAQTRVLPGSGGGLSTIATETTTNITGLLAGDGSNIRGSGQTVGQVAGLGIGAAGASNQIRLPNGNSTTPSLSFLGSGSYNTGLYATASNEIGFTQAGTLRWYVDASGNWTSNGTGLSLLLSTDAGVGRASASRINATNGSTGDGYFVASGTISNGYYFNSLTGTLPNGSIIYCLDCTPGAAGAFANCAGSGSGALAVRVAGVWRCGAG